MFTKELYHGKKTGSSKKWALIPGQVSDHQKVRQPPKEHCGKIEGPDRRQHHSWLRNIRNWRDIPDAATWYAEEGTIRIVR